MAETAIVAPAAVEAPKVDAKAAPVVPAKAEEATETIKVNGKEVKVTKAQLLTYAQKGMFADQKLKSMDVLQGKTKALIEALKTPEGLLGILKDPALGASPKEVFKKLMDSDVVDDELKESMAEWVYKNVVVQGKKTPEQIDQEKKLSEYERLKKQEEDRKKQEITTQQQQQIQQVYQAVRAEVTKQIVADKTFPQVEGAIRSVVDKLRVMNKTGAPITAENITKAIGFVKKDFELYQQTILDADDDAEALISRIGEARALKISKALVARLKKKEATKAKEENGEVLERNVDKINRKLGRTSSGHYIMDPNSGVV